MASTNSVSERPGEKDNYMAASPRKPPLDAILQLSQNVRCCEEGQPNASLEVSENYRHDPEETLPVGRPVWKDCSVGFYSRVERVRRPLDLIVGQKERNQQGVRLAWVYSRSFEVKIIWAEDWIWVVSIFAPGSLYDVTIDWLRGVPTYVRSCRR